LKCWNFGCTVDIRKGENWSPVNKIWIDTSSEMPHDLKQCYKESMIKQGKWKNYEKKEEPEYEPIIEYAGQWLWPKEYKAAIDHLRNR